MSPSNPSLSKSQPPAGETKEPKTSDVIESRIASDFNGWDGETIFNLTNGQIWQQAEYDYEYEYAFQPEVTIYKAAGGYKMKVEGMDDTIYVRRISAKRMGPVAYYL